MEGLPVSTDRNFPLYPGERAHGHGLSANAERLLHALRAAPAGLSMTHIRNVFHRHLPRELLVATLAELHDRRLAFPYFPLDGRRTRIVWLAGTPSG